MCKLIQVMICAGDGGVVCIHYTHGPTVHGRTNKVIDVNNKQKGPQYGVKYRGYHIAVIWNKEWK